MKNKVIALRQALLMSMLYWLCMTNAFAINWQMMIMPESDNFIEVDPTHQTFQDASLSMYQKEIERGIQSGLSIRLGNVVDNAKVFENCSRRWCSKPSLAHAVDNVRNRAPNVQLIVLYSLESPLSKKLSIQAIDPISFNVIAVHELSIIDEINANSAFSLAKDLSLLLASTLENKPPILKYYLNLAGFEFSELDGIASHVLSKTENIELVLEGSEHQYTFMNSYFPVIFSEYSLITILRASQVENVLISYFEQKDIDVSISFDKNDSSLPTFTVSRANSPYTPSLITSSLLALFVATLFVLAVRRQYLHNLLEEHANTRNADAWLTDYKKAKFPLYFLRSKWSSQALYWQSAQAQASEISSQARVYFDAGDTNTAKLFVSKALHKNKADLDANTLIKLIEEVEENRQQLSKSEQWVRNKIAKAMNNYKQDNVLKALKQLYQASQFAQKEKALKKQYKAINKLIKKVLLECYQKSDSLTLSASHDPKSYIVLSNPTIHLGRIPNKADAKWISSQDSVYFVNHKSVSRIGQHCCIQFAENGYEILDLGSKNGTYLNLQRLDTDKAVSISNLDKIHLGGNSSLTAASLMAEVSKNQSCLTLTFDTKAISLIDKQALNQIWPDHSLTINTQLICTQKTLLLLVNQKTKESALCDVFDYRDEKRLKDFTPICELSLGTQANIKPIDNHTESENIYIDGIQVLGQTPLFLPCELQFAQLSYSLNRYDSNNATFIQAPLIENHVLVTK